MSSMSSMTLSKTQSAIQANHERDFAFGHYASPKVWSQRNVGGYHENTFRATDCVEFKDWMSKWTSPEFSISRHCRHPADPPTPVRSTGLGMASALSTSRTTFGTERAPADYVPSPLELTAKTLSYPNPTNWKRSTSLPTRNPGHVGTLRTR